MLCATTDQYMLAFVQSILFSSLQQNLALHPKTLRFVTVLNNWNDTRSFNVLEVQSERGLVKRVNTWFLSKEKFQQNLIKNDEINTLLNKKEKN